MKSLLISFRYTVGTFYNLVLNLFYYPFSKLARHRFSAVYDSLKFPFYGNSYVDISELLHDKDLEVHMVSFKSKLHNVSSFELAAITAFLKDKHCNTIFEIGTYDGRTTRNMAMNLKSDNAKIYTLNLPVYTKSVSLETDSIDIELAHKVNSGELFLNTPEASKIEQLWGDSATLDFSIYWNKIDLVFIDGAHSVEYVANDTCKALQLIKPTGGWIIWHDAPYFGVVKFLKKWIPLQNGPVYFIKGTSLAIAYVANNKVTEPVL